MSAARTSLATLAALRRFVHETLCRRLDLDARYTPLQEFPLQRKGRMCGLFFQLRGPRLVKAYAVWSAEDNRILFHNARGERIAEAWLSDGPDPQAGPGPSGKHGNLAT